MGQGQTASPEEAAREESIISAQTGRREETHRGTTDFRRDSICVAYRVPMESFTQELWQRQRYPPALSEVAEGWLFCNAVAGGIGRVRRHGVHSLAMAEHRWSLTEGTDGS